jgi:hypothetical protein
MMICLKPLQGLKQDQYQHHNGNIRQGYLLKSLNEDYYSSQESEEVNTDSEGEMANDEGNDNPDIYVTRSGRKSKPPERLHYDVQSCPLSSSDHEDQESWSEQHLLACKASTDPYTMYHHQAMKQPDREKFKEAMQKECEAHYKEGNYKLIKRDELPEGAMSIQCVANEKEKEAIHRRNKQVQSQNEC